MGLQQSKNWLKFVGKGLKDKFSSSSSGGFSAIPNITPMGFLILLFSAASLV